MEFLPKGNPHPVIMKSFNRLIMQIKEDNHHEINLLLDGHLGAPRQPPVIEDFAPSTVGAQPVIGAPCIIGA